MPRVSNDSIKNEEMSSTPLSQPLPETLEQKSFSIFRHKVLAVTVLAGIIAGFFGGFAATAFIASRPGLEQKLNGGNTEAGRKIILQEDSAIIDVVKQASPAVVSIVISKDISTQRYSTNNPYNNFFDFFGLDGQGQPQQNTNRTPTPNIQEVGAGSGFFVSSDGLILTNRHVVSDETATYSVVTNEGETYDAKVVSRDPVNDLALIKISISNAPVLKFADTSSLQIGEQVIAIGNSLGQYQNTVTTGIISGIGRSIVAGDEQGSEQLEGVIQTDAAINPGNSGGPLLDLSGEVIGINTAIDQDGQSVGFAIPANDAKKALESYKKVGHISRPYVGIRYLMLTEALAKTTKAALNEGALITSGDGASASSQSAVIAGSPAAKAGLKEGDIISKINNHAINTANTLSKELKNYNVGDILQIEVYRQGKYQTLSLTLGETK